MERKGAITFKGEPMTLVGPELAVGEQAPDFTAVGNDLKPVKLSDLRGNVVVISAVPSLDTGVCAEQTRRFNKEADGLSAKILTISMDLPFAQSRFCNDNSIKGLTTVSDYKDRTFAANYGLYIKELGLLARAVLVIDKDGKIVHREIVPEITTHPNYDMALSSVKKASA
jgi:thiol peroxidase